MTQLSLEGDRGGDTYEPKRDKERLNKQHVRVWSAMRDGQWYTLKAVSHQTGDPEASISARLRDFRKTKFGSHTVERKYVSKGLWKYRLVWNENYPRPTTSQIVLAYD